MRTNSFPKHERLASKTVIDNIFKEGKSFFSHPIRAVYKINHQAQEDGAVKALFVVPKRNIRKAVKRNILKRRMREAYRLSKLNLILLSKENNAQLNIAFIYVFNEIESYSAVNSSMVGIIKRLEKLYPKQKNETSVNHDSNA